MNVLYCIMGLVLTVLFFLNIKSAADILCRTAGGFVLLLIYNSVASLISLPVIGVNLISSLICGVLSTPGWLFLFLATVFL